MAKPSGFTYTTLDYVKFLIGATSDSEDAQVWNIIRNASTLVTGYAARIFIPYGYVARCDETHVYDLNTLHLRDDVLAVSAIMNGNGIAIGGADFTLLPEADDPKRTVLLTSADWAFTNIHSRIVITGTFGFSSNYARAWGNSLDDLRTAIIDVDEEVIAVDDPDGLDDRVEIRFQIGDYLLIDSEQMQVRDKDATANTLTVIRGVNNTTRALHNISTPIYVWRQNEDVRFATAQIAVWLYKNKDTVNQLYTVPGGEERVGGLSNDIWEALDQFKLEPRRVS